MLEEKALYRRVDSTEEEHQELAVLLIQVEEVVVQVIYGELHTSFQIVWLLRVVEEAVFVMIISQLEGMVVIQTVQAALAKAAMYLAVEEHLHLVAQLVRSVPSRDRLDKADLCVETMEVEEAGVGTEAGRVMQQAVEAAPVIFLAPWSLMV